MCTTYLATELVREFSDLDILGNPRLVRLNPNVPWKTRGNGAISLKLGIGRGQAKKIGELSGKSVKCYARGENVFPTREHFKRACQILESLAVFEDENTNPGIVLASEKPPAKLYWQAVRTVVKRDEHLSQASIDFKRGYKNGRGLIGAASAIAWCPRDRTHELIAYREKSKWGKPREVNESSVLEMDKAITSTFNNYDYEEKRVAFAPKSPCPVLFGIRGDVEKDLLKAVGKIKSEKKDRWLVFLTNQGTDDHIIDASISNLTPYTSVRVGGRVASAPRVIKGGHLIFSLANKKKVIDCTIYEPAKGFRRVGEKLQPGDRIVVQGAVRETPLTINVEKLKVEKLAAIKIKSNNPLCHDCSKRMKSLGTGQGYRCARCGKKAGESKAEFTILKREIKPGWYEPPVGSRRHLAKPLKRMR
jgi:tRNA(Ile2)-agmatinylcytidine synthase